MKTWAICMGLWVLLNGIDIQAADGPVGYVIKVKIKERGSVLLKRGEMARKTATDRTDVPITPKSLAKRIYVYEGDSFKMTGEVVVLYFSGNDIRRAANGETIIYYANRPGSQTPRGRRPQEDPNEKDNSRLARAAPQFLFGEKRQRNLYVPVQGPLGVVWFNPPGYRAINIRVERANKILFSESIPPDSVRKEMPIGICRSENLASALRALTEEPNGADVTLSITFSQAEPQKSGWKMTDKCHVLPAAQARNINFACRQWNDAEPDLAFDRLNQYWMALEKENCGMECVVRLVDWWAEDTENYAANAAMYALALRSECAPLERILSARIKEGTALRDDQ